MRSCLTRVPTPRTGASLAAPLVSEEHEAEGTIGLLIHHTKVSGLRVGAVMDHLVDGPSGTGVESTSYPDSARVTVTTRLEPGESCASSSSSPTVVGRAVAAGDPRPDRGGALRRPIDRLGGLLAEQRA